MMRSGGAASLVDKSASHQFGKKPSSLKAGCVMTRLDSPRHKGHPGGHRSVVSCVVFLSTARRRIATSPLSVNLMALPTRSYSSSAPDASPVLCREETGSNSAGLLTRKADLQLSTGICPRD